MPEKLELELVKIGDVFETTFVVNPVEKSRFRFKATHLNGREAPKIVLCSDPAVRAGVPCYVKVTAIRKPERSDHGAIEVTWIREVGLQMEGIYLDPLVARDLQIALEYGLNVLLEGPHGSGKTVAARGVALAMGYDYHHFNCASVMDPSDFLATLQVTASESGQAVTKFLKTDLLAALEAAESTPDRNFLIFLDELNRCSEQARNVLMPALDGTRAVYNPITNRAMAIPENVQFIAAVNIGTIYSGTYGIDPAQLDRFVKITMDYPPGEEEVKLLLARHPELDQAVIKRIVTIANAVRSAEDIEGGLSVRATDHACLFLKHPLIQGVGASGLAEVLKVCFAGRFHGRWNEPESPAALAWEVIRGAIRKEE